MVDDTPCTFRRPLNASIAINKQRPLPVTQYDVVSLYLQRALRSLAEGKGRNKSDSRPLDFPVFSLVHLILLAFVPTYLKRYESRGRRRWAGVKFARVNFWIETATFWRNRGIFPRGGEKNFRRGEITLSNWSGKFRMRNVTCVFVVSRNTRRKKKRFR